MAKTEKENTYITVKPDKNYYVRRIVSFPFSLPSYLVKMTTMPIRALAQKAEETYFFQKFLTLLSNKDFTTWYYPYLEFGSSNGFGAGFGIYDSNFLDKKYKARLQSIYFFNKAWDLQSSLQSPEFNFLNRPLKWKMQLDYFRKRRLEIYSSFDYDNSDEALFSYEKLEGAFAIEWQLRSDLNLELNAALGYDYSSSSDKDPKAEVLLGVGDLAAFNQRIPYFLLEIELEHDSRDAKNNPENGGYRRLKWQRYFNLNSSEFQYNELSIDLAQFFSLGKPRYVLVLKNEWRFQFPDSGHQIPFYRQIALGEESPLRSYEERRFRARKSVVFNAEYRYPIWDHIDGTVFLDLGQAFNSFSDFNASKFKYSLGAGIHFRIDDTLLFRMQYAYGAEGGQFFLSFSHAL